MKKWKRVLPLLPLLLAGRVWADDGVDSISRGEYLAKAGDCGACHSPKGSEAFAGGLKMSTPVGAIYSTNITSDKETGIGNYSYDEFANALRHGVAKDGHHLYPAMPYTSFAKINDTDMHALYDYFMQVKAVNHPNRDSDIPWPLSMRWPLAMWDWVFHDDAPFKPDSTQSGDWNQGAYLVQGLGHCGSCHTPRGIGFQEKGLDQRDADYLTGGTLEGWHAPNLTGNRRDGLGTWKINDIKRFLKTGHNATNTAFGPMGEVVEQSTQHLSDDDLNAIAVYLKALSASDPDQLPIQADNKTVNALIRGDVQQTGAQEYVDNCAACHRLDGKGYQNTFPALAQNSAVMSDDPSSLISLVLKGDHTPSTKTAPSGLAMPDFGWRLDDQQAADVVTFIRNAWGNQAPAVTADQVKKLRPQENQSAK
jgi:mono/diheme cytochrome c family protein